LTTVPSLVVVKIAPLGVRESPLAVAASPIRPKAIVLLKSRDVIVLFIFSFLCSVLLGRLVQFERFCSDDRSPLSDRLQIDLVWVSTGPGFLLF
jgi:hypothetical protein